VTVLNTYALTIYTDGSSYSGPRVGGFAMLFIFPEQLNRDSVALSPPGYKKATNNQMELMACVEALKASLNFEGGWSHIIIRTDSMYVSSNYKNALYQWSKNRWMKRDGAPVLNAELWKELIKAVRNVRCRVDIEWVKGHEKDANNKLVDRLARASAKRASHTPLSVVTVRRKSSNAKSVPGGVGIEGQKVTLKIVTAEYLRIQKLYRYKYEILSKKSPYRNIVDTAVAEFALLAAHRYLVRFNSDKKNPRIIEKFREIGNKTASKTAN
jgi:ribonuclease HI